MKLILTQLGAAPEHCRSHCGAKNGRVTLTSVLLLG